MTCPSNRLRRIERGPPFRGGPMKRSKFTDEQILAIVKEREAGRKVADLCRANGVTEQTYYRWKAKYGGMELSEMQRLKQLDDENRRLKQIVAEQTLDIRALKAVVDDENNDREIESNSESENDLENWLGGRDSNPDNGVQSAVSYR